MLKSPAGNLDGVGAGVERAVVGQGLDAKGRSSCRRAWRPVRRSCGNRGRRRCGLEMFSIRSSTHLTGLPSRIEAATAQT
ncbi:MAG: hypothetical protein MPW15_00695 [Candidatus Manganitrophus sp.]|nr:hypothetical protein [Candidatus Manganitrophus sp.]